MTEQKTSKSKAITSQFSAEAIAAGGGILGLFTILLLMYQNYLMADQTAEMIATNKEMIYQRKMQEKERYNHLLEILFDTREEAPKQVASYKREMKGSRYNSKIRTEAFHEAVAYLLRVNRKLDFSGGLVGSAIDFRNEEYNEINLKGADLIESRMTHSSLKMANLSDCDFYGADISNTDLSEANLKSSYLFNANLSEAILVNADLSGAFLKKTNMTKAKLTGANLSGTVFIDHRCPGFSS
ncbi:MAG: pentapeptide repeat-containing protein [Lentisphaeraceae bacterium]|nr:pentapeptide repeat-containing protein [Lentisphaeraceae bacterium]